MDVAQPESVESAFFDSLLDASKEAEPVVENDATQDDEQSPAEQPEPEQAAAPDAAAEATRDQPELTPEQIEHRRRSAEGRARAEFNRRQRELAEQAAKFIPQGQPENAQIDLSELDDLAPALKQAFIAQQQEVNQLKQAIASLTQSQIVQVQANDQQEIQAALSRLNQQLPGWDKDVASPAFNAWVETLPPAVAALAASSNESDVAYLVSQFRTVHRPAIQQAQAQTQQRQERLQQAVSPVSAARPARDMSGGEAFGSIEEAFFAHIAARP